MALGKLKWVNNLDPRLGTNNGYWLVKVQADYSSDAEEFWLVTKAERAEFVHRANQNPEDVFNDRRGVFTALENTERPKFTRAATSYYAVEVAHDGERERWFLTDRNMERLRNRTSLRCSTLEANKTGWLADLFD